ncbi:hypothetical protein J6590_050853 [Homalodisca vitripennis]|nr:hypothetical protein J6590_050853 [Homalodisca vitripennis]
MTTEHYAMRCCTDTIAVIATPRRMKKHCASTSKTVWIIKQTLYQIEAALQAQQKPRKRRHALWYIDTSCALEMHLEIFAPKFHPTDL